MKPRFLLVLAAGLSLLASVPASAADNLPATMGNATKTPFAYRAFDLGGGIYLPAHALLDPTGVPFLTSANPGFFTLSGVLPLPTGAATSALQTAGNSSLSSLDAKTPALVSGRVPVDGSGVTQPVSSASLGAPADAAWDGAAASASQPSILKAIWSKLSGLLTVDTVVRAPAADKGAILTGASQQLAAANPNRRGLIIQNKGSADFNYNCRGLTAADDEHNFRIPAGQAYDTPPHHSGTGVCNGIGASGGKLVFLEF
jgi:hypothetical protein